MNIDLRRTIYSTAKLTRAWAEAKAGEHHTLCGYCAKASAHLHTALKTLGVESHLCLANTEENGSHVFLLIEDYVVDVTATQFSELAKEHIVIMHTKEAQQYDFYQAEELFDSPAKLRKYQKQQHWPSYQVA